MRLLLLIPLAAISCATAAPPPRPVPGRADAPITPPGFDHQPDESVTAYALAHPGKPDAWAFTVQDAAGKEVLVRKEKDLNGDGKIDVWELYAPDGSLSRAAYDLDFDGKPDVTLFYEKGQLVRKETAFGFDGVGRAWSYYEKGKLVRKERDTDGDGKVDTWEYWSDGEVERIGVDTDGDGQVDRWETRRTGGATPAPAASAPAPLQK
jgi:hypothetical protein